MTFISAHPFYKTGSSSEIFKILKILKYVSNELTKQVVE